MTVAFIFFGSIIAYSILLLGFFIKDYTIGIIGSMAVMGVGVYVAVYNVEGLDNILTQAFALVSIGFGAYVLSVSSIENIGG